MIDNNNKNSGTRTSNVSLNTNSTNVPCLSVSEKLNSSDYDNFETHTDNLNTSVTSNHSSTTTTSSNETKPVVSTVNKPIKTISCLKNAFSTMNVSQMTTMKKDNSNKLLSNEFQNLGTLKRQKSASTEFLMGTGKATCDMVPSENIKLDLEPPQIQPYSGVLSKSLFSVIIKPQPVKPVIEFNSKNILIKSPIPTSLITKLEESTYKRNSDLGRLGNFSTRGKLNKKKCISINNLLYDSNSDQNAQQQQQQSQQQQSSHTNSARSVTFLGPTNNQLQHPMVADSLSDNSIDIDDLDNYDSENQVVDVIIENKNKEVSIISNEKQRIAELEEVVKQKMNEINELNDKLRNEMEKVMIIVERINFIKTCIRDFCPKYIIIRFIIFGMDF